MASSETTLLPARGSSMKWIPLAMLYAGTAAFGVVQCFTENPNVLWLVGFLMAVSAIFWVSLDGRGRQTSVPHIGLLLMLFVWMIAVPIWLIWTRGFRGFGWAILNACCLFATIFISFYLTLLIGWGPEALFQN